MVSTSIFLRTATEPALAVRGRRQCVESLWSFQAVALIYRLYM